ncbi:hypothetical protein AYK25_00645 [Thermoplasmatales archaeon SM1-50]|nr:MAG: hypothetical protein AYK25_00645 [Thermoplasmatales archaeon SM1-50]
MNLRFDLMTELYAKEVIDIFNYYITHSFAAYPESPMPYQFYNKFLEITKGYPAFIIKNSDSGKVIGFVFYDRIIPFQYFGRQQKLPIFW